MEEERAVHEAAAAKLAEDKQAEEEERKQQESLEEERMLQSMIEDEQKRQRAKVKETKRKNQPPTALMSQLSGDNVHGHEDGLTFDQQIECLDTTGNPVLFQVVSGKSLVRMYSILIYCVIFCKRSREC